VVENGLILQYLLIPSATVASFPCQEHLMLMGEGRDV